MDTPQPNSCYYPVIWACLCAESCIKLGSSHLKWGIMSPSHTVIMDAAQRVKGVKDKLFLLERGHKNGGS